MFQENIVSLNLDKLCLERGLGHRLEFVTHCVEGPLVQVLPCTREGLGTQLVLSEGQHVVDSVNLLNVCSVFLLCVFFFKKKRRVQ